MTLAQKLKTRREELSLTQTEVAEKIFVSQKSISNWERGKTYPDLESLIHLAHFYELSLDELLLKESDLVKDLKIKAQISSLNKLVIPSVIINLALISIILSQRWWGELSTPVLLIIMFCLFLNFIPLAMISQERTQLIRNLTPQKISQAKMILQILAIIAVALIACLLILSVPKLLSF